MILKTDNSLPREIRKKLNKLIAVNNWAYRYIIDYDTLEDFDHAVLIKFGRIPPSIIKSLWRNRAGGTATYPLSDNGLWLRQTDTRGRDMQAAMRPGCLWVPTVGLVPLPHIQESIPWHENKYILIRKEGNQFKFKFEETPIDFEDLSDSQSDNTNILQRLYSVEQRLFAMESYFRQLQTEEEQLAGRFTEMTKRCTQNHT